MIKEELYEKYILAESKTDFIANLIPESESALYFKVLHEFNTQSTLSKDALSDLAKLQQQSSKHQDYGLHNLDFLRILRILNSTESSLVQKEKALEDLKHYLTELNFEKFVGTPLVEKPSDADKNQSSFDQKNLFLSKFDDSIMDLENYLSLAYSNLHKINLLSPACLYKLDPTRLISESATSKDCHEILERFLSVVPCLHQVKDVPLIYKALIENYKLRNEVFSFSRSEYDNLSLSQLTSLGVLLKDEVFETTQFQLAMIKKLFFKDLRIFQNLQSHEMTKLQKRNKKTLYLKIYEWALVNLPKKLDFLVRLLRQELLFLNKVLQDFDSRLFSEYIQNPPLVYPPFNEARIELFNNEVIQSDEDWGYLFEFENIDEDNQVELIEQYLIELLRSADSIKPYDEYFEELFLNKIFVKTKILSGQQSYIASATEILSKKELEEIITKRRITILDTNERYIKGNDEVKLAVEIKNIQNLRLNIFEVQTESYYLEKKEQFDNEINLNGLIPAYTQEFTYKDPSNQAVLREFSLVPIQNANRGIFIVEFFGNSISSKAVFKKGLLTIINTPTIAGHLLCIVDEDQNICKPTENIKTGIWLFDRFHNANKDGQIIIPYQNDSDYLDVIPVHDGFAELSNITVQREKYSFDCSYLYNPESFLQGSKAKILIHVSLSLNEIAADMKLIENQVIKVNIRNHLDIPTLLEFRDVKFDPLKDVEIEVPIQTIVKSLTVSCSGEITKMDGSTQDVSHSKNICFELHEKPANQIFGLYLKQNQSQEYIVLALDKTGQPIEEVPIEFNFINSEIEDTFKATLQTDKNGQVILGKLKNVTSISADVKQFRNFPNINEKWNNLKGCKTEFPDQIYIIENEVIEIPLSTCSFSRDNITFYSMYSFNGYNYVLEDIFEVLKKEGDFITIQNLKEGLYNLNLFSENICITIQVYQGKYWTENRKYIVTKDSFIPVERPTEKLITIKEAIVVPQNEKEADIIVNLDLPQGLNQAERKKLRVHLFGYTFLQREEEKVVTELRDNRITYYQEQTDLKSTPANFSNNNKIGDELCYVYQRRNEQKRIGNTLEKPCVLLKRTFNRETTFEKEKLDQENDCECACMDEDEDRMEGGGGGGGGDGDYYRNRQIGQSEPIYVKQEIDTFLNILSYPCFVSSNNQVNDKSQILIHGFEWENYSSIKVIVVSDNVAISNRFSTNQDSIATQDLRHQSTMKPDELYTENLSSGQLLRGKQLVISADCQTAVIGSIPELFEIQKVLMKTGRRTDEYLGKAYGTWGFLKEWTGFNDRQKLEKYNEFASHELNLFLYFKDAAFFKMVVAPFIRNKLQKQFLDLFLLEDLKRMEEFASTERINELNVLEQVLLIQILVKNEKIQDAKSLVSSIEQSFTVKPKNNNLKKRLFLTIIESSVKTEVNIETPRNKLYEKMYSDPFGDIKQIQDCKVQNKMKKEKEKQQDMKFRHQDEETSCEERELNTDLIMAQRKELKVGYKKLDKTVEYVERNYFGDNKTDNYSNLVTVNPFWVDLAKHLFSYGSLANFVSENFIFAFNNHVEALAVLALMDLSFSARDNYDISNQPGRKIQITAKNNVLFFSKEILKSTEISKANVSIIQTFFDPYDKLTTLKDDPTVQIEKEVEEFLVNKIYGTKVIITNTSIANLNLQVLSEIPSGSIPVNSFEYTKSIDVLVNSYQTVNTLEFFFYFPKPGSYTVYRSNASRNGRVVAQAAQIPAIVVKAVPEIRKMENLSDILNNGSKEDILNFARTSNLRDSCAFKISQIYHLLQSDKVFFTRFLDICKEQRLFLSKVWEYSLLHNYEKGVLELLNNNLFRKTYLNQNYSNIFSFSSSQLSIDNFTPFEYHPLLTSRAHSFMNQNKSKILNVEFKQTYADYLAYLAHVPQPTGKHYLLLCYYLLLQERIEEALTVFSRISKAALDDGEAAIQRDYLSAYLDIYTGGPNFKLAREISERYLEYPIISWRNLFVNLSNQLAEYDGYSPDESEEIGNTDLSTNLKNAEKEQSVSIEIKDKQLVVLYQNVDSAEINFYQLDLEVLFSTQPFMLDSGDRREFTFIKPNAFVKLTLPKSTSLEKKIIDIPSHLAKKNLYIQLVSAAGVQSLSYFSSSLKAQILDKFGQVKVTDESNSPLQKVYVKCFAKYEDDSVAFFRDGYTDLRGRFDYALSSVNDITEVNQFSIFICSEEHGALIRECPPPSTQNRMETTITLLSKKK